MPALQGLFVETQRCPDGYELTTLHGRPHFLGRTERLVPVRLEMQNLENPAVVEFINAGDDDSLLRFFSAFGRTSEAIARRYELEGQPSPEGDRGNNLVAQMAFRTMLERATGSNQADMLRSINDSLGRNMAIDVTPTFELDAETGIPRMMLKCVDLAQYMTMEIAMVAMHGAKLGTCEHCGNVFLTGHLTGRRSTAKYCSDKCRVAAMRVRNAAKS